MHIFTKLQFFKSKQKNNNFLVLCDSSKHNCHNKIQNKNFFLKKKLSLIMNCLTNSALNSRYLSTKNTSKLVSVFFLVLCF